MRLNLVENLDDQVASLRRDLDELKNRQPISQDSGILAYLNEALDKDDFGDIVEVSNYSGSTKVTSHIQVPATSGSVMHSLYCEQFFYPRNLSAAVAPYIILEVKSGGLTGKSEIFFDTVGLHFGLQMKIYNSSGTQVGGISSNQSLGELLNRTFDPKTLYKWTTNLSYSCSVPFELSYKFLVRSSSKGATMSTIKGTGL